MRQQQQLFFSQVVRVNEQLQSDLIRDTMLPLILPALLLLQHVDSSPVPDAKKAPQEDWLTRAQKYIQSNPETLEELMTNKNAVLQGDMVMSPDRNAVEYTWPAREIPYVIGPGLESKADDILAAMEMVSEETCVTFHKRTSETNYLLFQTSRGCASYVGFIGGEQPVFIGPPCRRGNIVHEILHALGFHHEHTRTDREKYITILTQNIMTGMEKNFKKQEGQTFKLPYDITSIMHYGSGFFSANGLPTIVPSGDVKDMGQRARMTETDIDKVRLLYSCDSTLKEEEDEEKSEAVEKEQDSTSRLFHDKSRNRGRTSAREPEERPTSPTSCPPASVQQQTSRGRNNTSRGEAGTTLSNKNCP